ncbi:MAG: lycopene cyclase domain-containing protein [Bacteroidota bacterium]
MSQQQVSTIKPNGFVLAAIVLTVIIVLNWYFFLPGDPVLTYEVFQLSNLALLERDTLYLWINLFTISGPLILSFDKKVAFWRSWKYVFPSIFLTMLVFIPWDIVFTRVGVWGFNPNYYFEPGKLLSLPPGEWLFFITVPYACIFIYACLLAYVKKDVLKPAEPYLSYGFMAICLIAAISFWGNLYTSTTCLLTAGLIAAHVWIWKSPWLSRFYLAYFVSLFPFFLVNGMLTGGFTENPVVLYNDLENMGLRVTSIPADDLIYALLLLLMNMSWLEFFRRSRNLSTSN